MSKRQNKILPAALATTLAFGAAPFAVSADVDFNTLSETFPATAEWTETDWNTYLEENYGTDLTDYDTNEELVADLGGPVDINAWISDQSDANILDAMERYDITSEELAVILENNDYRENIHFVGDLENVLETEGFTEVNAPAVTEEPEVVEEAPVDDDELIDDEVAEAEIYDDTVVEGEEEVDAALEGVDLGPIAIEDLEEAYLNPLGWEVVDFNDYLLDEYDMAIEDFEDFAALEAMVGPAEEIVVTEEPAEEEPAEEPATEEAADDGLTDENLSSTLYMYGLTEDDYLVFLEENGYAEGDFTTVSELEAALEEAGYTVVNAVDGEEMPDTATNAVQNALIGTGIALLGAAAFFTARRREGEQ